MTLPRDEARKDFDALHGEHQSHEAEVERRAADMRARVSARGGPIILIPAGPDMPAETTDAEAQRRADELLAWEWCRKPDGAVEFWGEM